jgi:hypothetical protein
MEKAITLETSMAVNPAVKVRETPFGAVLLNPESGACWELNAVGAAVWSSLASGQLLRETLEEIARRYGIAPSVVEADTLLLLSDLTKHGLIEIRS